MQFLAANAAEEVTVSVSCSFKHKVCSNMLYRVKRVQGGQVWSSAIRMGSSSGDSFGKRSGESMHKRFGEWMKRNGWPVVW